MRRFAYLRVSDAAAAVEATARAGRMPPTLARAQFLAGGTTLLDLMKLDVMRPETVVDINDLKHEFAEIRADPDGLHLGAFASMAETARHPGIVRDYPVIAQSLDLAASPQIRNMATLGGNVLQRTRCNYFRDGWEACNKRNPGSGCVAIGGINRKHAVLGTSRDCIAAYPGDFAQALIALDAEVRIAGTDGARTLPFERLHVAPGTTPHIETTLRTGDVILGFFVPAQPWTRHSLYLKIRDRESYEFALASAAVAVALEDRIVRDVRVALGGVATKPWRSREAEAVLRGNPLTPENARTAADAAFASAVTHGGNEFKPELGRRTLVRALLALGEA
jgi:xanthine dehydrogenase YagS FAD-binding subunit